MNTLLFQLNDWAEIHASVQTQFPNTFTLPMWSTDFSFFSATEWPSLLQKYFLKVNLWAKPICAEMICVFLHWRIKDITSQLLDSSLQYWSQSLSSGYKKMLPEYIQRENEGNWIATDSPQAERRLICLRNCWAINLHLINKYFLFSSAVQPKSTYSYCFL